ncbi:glycoside hydrolase family 2 protein [Gracilibacillus phocaeensis]|uniref:glycoside hydrolase family 2 protein n=1 Tax=Gracilibacillus phocaeensis TaxID=2042304 RepID=UPI003D9C2883
MNMTTQSTHQRTDYPRPQFQREDWQNLNGAWQFAFDDQNQGEKAEWFHNKDFDQTIQVPFTYETKASGIGEEAFHPYIWYKREVEIPAEQAEKRVILRFQASDFLTKVWINGKYVGDHQGGNAAFAFDISDQVRYGESNQVVVKVEDSYSCYQPRGKQRWVDYNFGCWYVQTTGIWQTVWLEYLPTQSLDHVKMEPNIDQQSIAFTYHVNGELDNDVRIDTLISFEGKSITQTSIYPQRNQVSQEVDLLADFQEWKLKLWSPAHPNLYDVHFKLYVGEQLVDEVTSYFGMRKVSIKDGQVLLNNSPVYQKLLLDQGYWPDSSITPPSEEAIIEDIDKTLAMGFNGVRKHQKIEDDRFMYWCDKKGVLVWSEMAATYEYGDEAVEQFTKEWLEIVQQRFNHPSIITWVPFNESWGVPNIFTNKKQQAFTEAIYHLTKSIDPERPVIVNDGWEHTISDIIALHDYEEFGQAFIDRYQDKETILGNKIPHNKGKYAFAEGYSYKGQPVMLTEYGGIAFQDEKGWGYGNQVDSEVAFLKRYREITDAIKSIPYITGYCYTQTTDVQQEVNGLLYENREPKIAMEKIKEINDA